MREDTLHHADAEILRHPLDRLGDLAVRDAGAELADGSLTRGDDSLHDVRLRASDRSVHVAHQNHGVRDC